MNQKTIEMLTQQLHQEVVDMLAKGIRAREVADEFGMTERQVYRIARIARQPMMYRASRRSLLLKLLKQGKSYKEVAKILGVKPESAYRTALRDRHRKNEVTPRSTRSKT